MKKRQSVIAFLVGSALFAVTASLLCNFNLKKYYRPGDYVPEEGAYYGGEGPSEGSETKAHKFVVPTDSQYSTQKSRSMSNVGNIESVWDSYTGAGTKIAIIDDGFDYEHPEYIRSNGESAILSASRYYYHINNNYYYKEYSEDPTCIAEDWDSKYSEWDTHGTNTSTTAAAPINDVGGVGIAPDADILAIKVDAYLPSFLGAMRYAISQKVDAINLSWGWFGENFTDPFGDEWEGDSSDANYLEEVCQQAYNAGIIVVASAGNEAAYQKSYPACNYKVVGVGALDKNSDTTLAPFTNYVSSSQTGEINVDILAPGYVWTAHREGTQSNPTHVYNDTQGTSFSSPIVAAAACLWKQKYPNGTPDEFLTQLQSSAAGKGTYANKKIPCSRYQGVSSDAGPSNITNGRLDVGELLDIGDPYVSAAQENVNISVGEKKQIDIATSNGTLTYSSSNTNVAIVSDSGLIEGKAQGSATITVTASKNNKTATDTINVSVSAAIATNSMSFNPSSITLTTGQTYDAEPTIVTTPSNASRVFMYESLDTSVATVDEDTGVVTAVAEGDAEIYAAAINGSGEATLNVHVDVPTAWTRITSTNDLTNGDYLIVYEDGNVAFDGGLSTLDANNNTIDVSITSNSIPITSATQAAKFTINSISGGYSIRSASGSYIGQSTDSNGLTSSDTALVNSISFNGNNAEIIGSGGAYLRYNSDASRFRYYRTSSYTSQKAIQLYKGGSGGGSTPTPTPTVSSVTVSPSSLNLDLNGTTSGTLTATVNGTNNPAQTVTWDVTSANPSGCVSVSNSGVVTASAVGTATITATSTVDTTKSGTCTVTVTNSGSGGGDQPTADSYTILASDVPAAYGSATENTASSGLKFYTYNIMNQDNKIQFKKNGGYIYNSSSLDLDKVTLNDLGGSGTLTVYGGNSAHPTSNTISSSNGVYDLDGYQYFTIFNNSNNAVTATSITITTGSSGGTPTPTKTLSSIELSNAKTDYSVGDEFVKPTVTANYSDSTSANVTNSTTFSGYNLSVAGNYEVTASYTEGGVTKTAKYNIVVSSSGGTPAPSEPTTVTYTISSKTAASVSSGTAPTGSTITFNNNGSNDNDQMTSGKRELWTLTGYEGCTITKIEANLRRSSSGGSGSISLTNNSESVTLDISSTTSSIVGTSYSYKKVYEDDTGFECNGNLVLTISASQNSLYCNSIKVTYVEQDLSDKVLMSLSASYTGGDVYVGNSYNTSLVTVTAHYTDSSKYPDAVLSSSNYSLSEFSSATAGEKTITVTYTGSLQTLSPTVTTTFTVNVIEDSVTNVTVTNTSTYHPGETISKGDITVTLAWASGKASTTTTDFTFANDGYRFTYADAASGGGNTQKQFSITYAGQAYNFNVNVSRVNYSVPSTTSSSLTGTQGASAGITGTSASGAADYNSLNINGYTCFATNIYVYNGYFSFGKTTGELHNTVATSTPISAFSISGRQSGARTDEKLYVSVDGSTWVLVANADFDNNNYYFFKVACESGSSSYSNFNLSVTLKGQDNATNVANYIMYNDTNGQCTTKLDLAVNKLNNMSNAEKNTFWTSNDYVIATARERLLAWATHENKTIDYSNNSFIINSNRNVIQIVGISEGGTSAMAIIIVSALVGLTTVGGYFFLKRKKEY